jgi:DNA polymerase-3 subunit chi
MTEVRFYHLQTQSLEQAMPAILSKALAQGKRAIVRFGNEAHIRHFDEHLWTYNPDSFLPHGIAKEPHAEKQPILLTNKEENQNEADILLLWQVQTVPGNLDQFTLVCDFIDGRDDDSVIAGRARWKAYKEAGHTQTYWQQNERGGWEQKA